MVTIYIYLMNEKTDVWRPIEAEQVGDDVYRIVSVNQSSEDEEWEFKTGELVRCETKEFASGSALVAVGLVQAAI